MRAQHLHGRDRLVRVSELREEEPRVCGTRVSAPYILSFPFKPHREHA
jgi:hypothetical protein